MTSPTPSFVNTSLNYTHGYGVTAVSVNAVGGEGKPEVLVGQQPMTQVDRRVARRTSRSTTPRPPTRASTAASTRRRTSCPGRRKPEFNYPSGSGDNTVHANGSEVGIPITNPIDKLARLAAGLRRVQPLPQQLADGEQPGAREPPDPHPHHVAGAVSHRRRRSVHRRRPRDGSPHVDRRRVRQDVAVPRVVSAERRHVVHAQRREGGHRRKDLRDHALRGQPATSRSPRRGTRSTRGCSRRSSQISPYLRSHLRYPEDLFNDQAQAYAQVHITQRVGVLQRQRPVQHRAGKPQRDATRRRPRTTSR